MVSVKKATNGKKIAKADFQRATWKNGLGYTDQIAIEPPGADLRKGDFLWRISSARIEQSSAFSVFPEHDRILLILEGAGIRLHHRFEEGEPEDSTELGVFSPYEFPGDIQSRCELISGAITDLSVFIRKGEVEASVEVVELSEGYAFSWSPQSRWSIAMAPDATLEIESALQSDILRLESGDAFQVEMGETSEPVPEFQIRSPSGSCHLILIQIS